MPLALCCDGISILSNIFQCLSIQDCGILRPAIARKWSLAIGYAVGVAVGNVFSPFFGPLEIGFMPVMAFLSGILGYFAAKPFKRSYFVAGFIIAVVIAVSVSLMFQLLFSRRASFRFGSP